MLDLHHPTNRTTSMIKLRKTTRADCQSCSNEHVSTVIFRLLPIDCREKYFDSIDTGHAEVHELAQFEGHL
jgi:hypothetical protein